MLQTRPSLRTGVHDFRKLWETLEHDIVLLISDPVNEKTANEVWLRPEEFYQQVYRLCASHCTNVPSLEERGIHYKAELSDKRQGYVLYYSIKQLFEHHLRERVLPNVRTFDEELLYQYNEMWKKYSLGIIVIDKWCGYVNRDLLTKQNSVKGSGIQEHYTIKELGLVCWKEQLYMKIKKQLIPALLQQITRDRNGERIDHGLLEGILGSLVQLGLGPPLEKKDTQFYEEQFEAAFIEETDRYYSAEVTRILQEDTLPMYMMRIEKRLEQEQKRVGTCLHRSTEEPLMKILVKVMIENKQETLLSECTQWFDNDMVEEQKRLYRLLSRSENGLEPLRKIVEDRIDTDGKREIEKIKNDALREPNLFVETLLQVHQKYETMVNQIFLKDQQFVNALEKGCRRFINRNALSPNAGARSAELLAKYCHSLLKLSSMTAKNLNEQDLDIRISQVLIIFKLLEDKDVFQKFYSSHFSRRLIQHQYSTDMETNMISKLKEVCGYEYTYKLQRMFTDMDVSADLNKLFQKYLASKGKEGAGPDFTAQVLTSGSWPLNSLKSTFILPREVESRQQMFEEFYKAEHNGRKLSWLSHQLTSYGVLKTCYSLPQKRTYELLVNTYQMGILLLFNETATDVISSQMIQDSLQLPEKEYAFTLSTLTKNKILISSEAPDDEDKGMTYSINFEFKSPHRKVPLHTVAPKDALEDPTMKLVNSDRRHAIQAAIVRTMKARRQIGHSNLILEVLRQLKSNFKPTVQDIKKNIDHLIEKEYMERAEDVSSATYNYVA